MAARRRALKARLLRRSVLTSRLHRLTKRVAPSWDLKTPRISTVASGFVSTTSSSDVTQTTALSAVQTTHLARARRQSDSEVRCNTGCQFRVTTQDTWPYLHRRFQVPQRYTSLTDAQKWYGD